MVLAVMKTYALLVSKAISVAAGIAALDVVLSERLRPEDYPDKDVLSAMAACLDGKQASREFGPGLESMMQLQPLILFPATAACGLS